jgi:hypothetical protein
VKRTEPSGRAHLMWLYAFPLMLALSNTGAFSQDDRYRLLGPDQRLDGRRPDDQSRFLRPDQRLDGGDRYRNPFGSGSSQQVLGHPNENPKYYLLERDHLDYLRDHRDEVEAYGAGVFKRIMEKKALIAQAEYDEKIMILLARGVFPKNPLLVGAALLRYANMSIEQFQALTEEKRQREFCRYRVSIYRQNGIMYPPECIR